MRRPDGFDSQALLFGYCARELSADEESTLTARTTVDAPPASVVPPFRSAAQSAVKGWGMPPPAAGAATPESEHLIEATQSARCF